jgi:hypothetical protein
MKSRRKGILPAALLVSLFLLGARSLPALGQAIIESPDRPAAKDAGRTIPLQEILRIKDEGKGFFFKLPWGLGVGPDGSIFVQDGLALYKFSSDGRFERNLVKTGQGPGEITTEITDFLVDDKSVLFFSAPSNKLVKTDYDGKLLGERTFDKKVFYRLLAFYGQKYFMLDMKRKNPAQASSLLESDYGLFLVSEDGNFDPTSCSFTAQVSRQIRDFGGGRTAAGITVITRVDSSGQNGEFLYITHTPDYLIKRLDLKKAAVTGIFRRAYPRVKYVKQDPRDTRAMPDYDNDVYRVLVYKDRIWALTSTYDPRKGILVDVFDSEGKYADDFWLPLLNIKTRDNFSQRYFQVTIRGDFLYAIEHDADWSFSVVKYKITAGVSK